MKWHDTIFQKSIL